MNKLILFLYSVFLISFLFFSYSFVDLNLLYFHKLYTGFAFFNRQFVTLYFISHIFIFFGFFYIFLKRKFNPKFLIIITSTIFFFSYSAMLSYDIFNYMTTAKVIFKYHENPYVIMPIEFKGEPNLLFTHAANKISLYGPSWIVLSAAPFFLGFSNFVLTFFNFKLLIILFYIGTIFLVKKITRNEYSVILFALNPLIIIETLIGNHNDIVMMFLALFSFFLLIKKRIFSSILILIFSIFIKYATIFLIPVFIFTTIRILQNKKIDWNRIFLYSSLSMFLVFLLSFLRGEIYPWYAVWFLTFTSLIPKNKILLYISLAFSFGLLLGYVPFMLTGSYFGITPTVRILFTFIPVFLFLIYGRFKKVF